MRTLLRAHPLCCFAFAGAVLCVTIFTRNPVLLLTSSLGASLLLILTERTRFALALPVIVLVSAVTNPIFVHNGSTVLFFVNGLPVTLEAVLYGADFGMVLAASVGWSTVAVRFITSDKYIWLFGRVLPTAGLVLSCALRLVPLFIRRTGDFIACGEDSLRGRLRGFSAAVGYSAEEAMQSADCMSARGYGTAKRTSYSLYRLGRREAFQLALVMVFGGLSAVSVVCGAGEYYFYPMITPLPLRPLDIAAYVGFAVLVLLPSAAVAAEELKRSTIAGRTEG